MQALAIFMTFGFVPSPSADVSMPEKIEPHRVGQIQIWGNVVTKSSAILEEVQLFPGQVLPGRKVIQNAENRLLTKFGHRFRKRQRPRVEVLDDGTKFHTIKVTFPERESRKQ